MMPVANSYFSGGGLLDCGLTMAGLTVQQSFELEPECCDTLRLNFKHCVEQCDITRKLVNDELPCDVKAFTYPCTKYSPIADIHGARTGDELFLHSLRHMVIKPPEVYVIENVPGMRKFPVVMEAMTRLPDYYVNVFCPISSHTWLPQKRDRLIIIGSRKNFQWRPPETGRRVTLLEILEDDPVVDIPDYVYKRIDGEYRDLPIISDPASDDMAPTCVAHYAKDRSTRLVKDARFPRGVRPYTVREYARLQGVPDWFQFSGGENAAYRMIGNGVSVPVGQWIGSEIIRYFS
jgi:DNA (cytosine-5)-methyltransferase 1